MQTPRNTLRQRDFVIVLLGQVISLFGNAILRFALPLHLLRATGSAALFGGGALAGSVPTTQITAEQLAQDARVTTLAFLCGLCASKGEARKLVQGGGLTVGEEKVTDVNAVLTAEQIGAEGILLRKGKKSYHRLVLKA